jgi:hypothetical protein
MAYEIFFSPPNSFSCHYSATANSEDSTEFNSSAPNHISRQAGVSKLDPSLPTTILYSVASSDCVLLQTLGTDHTDNTDSIIDEACLQHCCLAIDVLLSRTFASAGMRLVSHCLAMSIHVTIS